VEGPQHLGRHSEKDELASAGWSFDADWLKALCGEQGRQLQIGGAILVNVGIKHVHFSIFLVVGGFAKLPGRSLRWPPQAAAWRH
jgi:hypothetical protein